MARSKILYPAEDSGAVTRALAHSTYGCPASSAPEPLLPLRSYSPAFQSRVQSALRALQSGTPESEILSTHGRIVLRYAKFWLSQRSA